MKAVRCTTAACAGLALLLILGGCPSVQSPEEFIAGSTGETSQFGSTASVTVVSPQTDLAVAGGTPVEVNWRVVARTRSSVVDVFLDPDTNPDNDNEILAFTNLALTVTTETLDTTQLVAGTYNVGVRIKEVGTVVAGGYAPGRLIINQRPTLYYSCPAPGGCVCVRDNLTYDRSERINPCFVVQWTVSDPDSVLSVQFFLDPDHTPNGNEILLRTATPPTVSGTTPEFTDSFSFDFPTATFAAGTYSVLAEVSDGVDTFSFYAPGSIRLRARLSGFIDLRDIDLPTSGIQGAVFEGFNPGDNAGAFVSSIGDVDGDGFGDFIILAQFGKPQYQTNIQRTGVGEAYLVYGRSDPFSGAINLNSTGTLFRGEFYGGVPEVADPIRPTRGITSFTTLTDWDGDGIREMAFGLPFTDSRAIVRLNQTINIAPLDQNGYFRTGGVVVVAGSSLRPDLGFPGRNVFNLAEFGTLSHMPRSCVACGSPPCPCGEGFYGPKTPDPLGCYATFFHQHLVSITGTPNDGSVRLGCRFSSNDFGDQFGETISSWDFDGFIVCAPNRDPSVAIERQFGTPVPGAGLITLFFTDVKGGFYPWANDQAPPANAAFNYPGSAQSSGDRLLPHGGPYHYILDDIRLYLANISPSLQLLLPGAPGYTVDPDDADNPCTAEVDGHISTPENSVSFWSDTPGARLSNVKGLGDVNADGLLDLVVGAPLYKDGAGACFIILGRVRDLIRGGELKLEELGLPMNSSDPAQRRIFDGIQIVGAPGERLGQAQDNAGDFNGDGMGDVVIGSPLLNNRQGGAVVFFGSRDVINLTQDEIAFNDIPARGLGVTFIGEEDGDLAGARVASAGDIDGDGLSDILIAAPNRSVRLDPNGDGTIEIDRTECGVVYLIYGSPKLHGVLSLSLVGTEQLPGAVFIGRNSQDHLGAGLGEQGDRSLGIAGLGDVDGDGAGDLMLGSVQASPRNLSHAGEAYLIYGRRD